MMSRWLIRSVTALLISMVACVAEAQTPRSPDVVIVVAADVDESDLGSYNPRTDADTPNLDRLAAEGIRFTQFYANASIAAPSHVALMTGLYPQRFGVRREFRECSERGIFNSPPWKTLAQRITALDRGYRTYHIGKWYLGVERDLSHLPLEHHPALFGYREFYGFFHEALLANIPRCSAPPDTWEVCSQVRYENPYLWRNASEPSPQSGADLPDLLTRRAVAEIDALEAQSSPIFMTLAYPLLDPTLPQDCGTKRECHVAGVNRLDSAIGEVFRALENNYLTKNRDALIFFMSDNPGAAGCVPPDGCGTPYPDCTHGPGAPDSDLHLRGAGGCYGYGGKGTFYEGGIRVPAIIYVFSLRRAAGAWRLQPMRAPVAAIDLVPTIMDYLGAPIGDGSVDGVSVSGPVFSGKAIANRDLFWEAHEDDGFMYAVRGYVNGAERKLIVQNRGTDVQLYDIGNDPLESSPIENPDDVDALQAKYAEWRQETSIIPYQVDEALDVLQAVAGGWSFADAGGVVLLNDHPLLNPHDGAMSVSLRVRAAADPGPDGAMLVAKEGSWGLVWSAEKRLDVLLWPGPALPCIPARVPTVDLRAGQKRLVLTFDHAGEHCADRGRGTVRLYVDGQKYCEGTYDEPLPRNAMNVHVGNSTAYGHPSRPFEGTVVDLVFFNVDLTAKEAVP